MEWNDAEKLANSTARASVSAQVSQLQAIRREVSKLEAPPCAAALQGATVAFMEATIDTFLAFIQDGLSAELEARSLHAETQGKALADIQARFQAGEELMPKLVELKAGGRSRLEASYVMGFGAAIPAIRADDAWSESFALATGQLGEFRVEAKSYPGELFCDVYSDGRLIERETSTEERAAVTCVFTVK